LDQDASDAKHPWIMPQWVPIVDPVDVSIGEFNICAPQAAAVVVLDPKSQGTPQLL
jgi:hypothetical protein